MYGEGACGHVTDPLLVWMKLEHCTLFVGCTSTFLEFKDDVTNTNDKDDSTYDGSTYDGPEGRHNYLPQQQCTSRRILLVRYELIASRSLC